jgi:ribosome recycling factor
MDYQIPQVEEIFLVLEEKIEKSISFMKNEFNMLKVGRANPKLLDKIYVDYYGASTPLPQTASVSVPEARMIVITPWDKSMLGKIEKAILAANIGVTPNNDGSVIRLIFPELTEERRKETVKTVKKLAEDAKVAVRNSRRDTFNALKKVKTDKLVSEDSVADFEKEVDKIVTKAIEDIDDISKNKENEIMSV